MSLRDISRRETGGAFGIVAVCGVILFCYLCGVGFVERSVFMTNLLHLLASFWEQVKHWFGQSRTLGVARGSLWRTIVREFARYVPKQCPFCGSTRVQLHHAEESFNSNPAREGDPTNLMWLCQGIGTNKHHQWYGHNGDFRSFNFALPHQLHAVLTRPYWNGKEWVFSPEKKIKYRLTETELEEWNVRFGTHWKYLP